MIQILSETAGLYLHPTPKRMLYVLVSEEPQTKVSCGLSIVPYVRIVRWLRHSMQPAVPP